MPVTYVKFCYFYVYNYVPLWLILRNSFVLYEWNYQNLCNNLRKHDIILIGIAKNTNWMCPNNLKKFILVEEKLKYY